MSMSYYVRQTWYRLYFTSNGAGFQQLSSRIWKEIRAFANVKWKYLKLHVGEAPECS